jgi:hypothetical protein
VNVFTRIFGGGGGPPPSTALAQRLAVIDYMRGDLARLANLVPASEKMRIDAHASAIEDLAARLRSSLTPPSGTCVVPPAPPVIAQNGKPYTQPGWPPSALLGCDYYVAGDPTSHPHEIVGQLHLALIKAAFQCDLVRVATFGWASGTSQVVFPSTFDGASLPGSAPSSPHYPPLDVDPSSSTGAAVAAWGAAIARYYATQTSLALQELDAATDVDGNSLLDNTIVVYFSEVARRFDHNQMNLPVLVFGGKNTRVNGGTFLKVTDGPLPQQPGSGGSATGNRPTNDLWLALAPVFGVNLASWGAPGQFTGPLPGLVT